MLTERQQAILRFVVEGYLRSGQPVGSKAIAASAGLPVSASTVRYELALLEEHGLLAHPHTSAGRVPTEAGHRFVVDCLLAEPPSPRPAGVVDLSLMRSEVEHAMRMTTATLSDMTNLLAIVTAPSPHAARIRHIEVLAIQAAVVAVVIITSTGGVSKTLVQFSENVDAGLVAWAGEYLGERLEGIELGARLLQKRLFDPGLSAREQAFLERLSVAFDEASGAAEDALYIDGAANLFAAQGRVEVQDIEGLMQLLEQRVAVLGVLHEALAEQGVYVRIGRENDHPALRSWALVASSYGLRQRVLGAVSVIGPVCMDYEQAITTVRGIAGRLSSYVEDAYTAS